jgi:SAM-dependent methyltransferase
VNAILSLVFNLVRPASVVDVGCSIGQWLAVASEFGATDVLGIDGDWVPTRARLIPSECFLEHDLEGPLRLDRRFDLAICLEVAEHVSPARADPLIQELCDLADVVLFSAAVPGSRGEGHLNEQWPTYWQARFGQRRYQLVDCLRARLWEDDEILWWYMNSFLYVNADRLTADERLRAAAAKPSPMPLCVVHPRQFEAFSPPQAPADPEPSHASQV